MDFDLSHELRIVANAMDTLCDHNEEYEQIAREFLATLETLSLLDVE